jgi:dTDP-glucose pyrophosphorylase
LEYSIFDAIRAGFTKVVFVIRRDFETEFKNLIGDKFKDTIEVAYAFQELANIPE